MKILFLRPNPSSETIGLQHLMIVEPLELEILFATIRPSDEAQIIDMILEKLPVEYFITNYKPDIICITGYISNVHTMKEYCAIAKKINPKIYTIIGGVHCEVCPEDFEDVNIDFRVIRNAAIVFPKLLNHIEFQEDIPDGILKINQNTDQILLPKFDYSTPLANRTSTKKYRDQYFYIFHNRVALMKTSYGCPFDCSFCFCRVITSGQYYQKPVNEVINELEQIDEKEIYIVDDDFLYNKKWLEEFIEQIKLRQIKKNYLVYSRADFISKNPDLMRNLKSIGLRTVIVGFESFTESELLNYNKKTSVAMYQETMSILKKEKIDCFATVIIPPHWDKSDFRNMVKAVKALGISYINLQPLTPLPKTDINFPESSIIVSRKDFAKWDLAHITVRPEKMSVADFYKQILKSYYSIIYRPSVMLSYLINYQPKMLIKMLLGARKVGKQYKQKIKESKHYA